MTIRWATGLNARFATALLVAVLAAGLWLLLAWPEDEVKSARVRPVSTLDLETGEVGNIGSADLDWGLQGRDLPFLAVRGKALIALPGGKRWEELDAGALAKLAYAANQYSAWGPDAPVKKGAVFGVRTREGNLAKLRVKDIRRNYAVDLEWIVYGKPAPEKAAERKDKPIPVLPWHALRDEALAAYREHRAEDAFEACNKTVAAAASAGEAHHALALVTCGGLLDLHRRNPAQVEDWLKQAKAITEKLDQGAIVAALGSREALLRERALRMLGIFYRDRARTGEAADNFALAVDAVRALPPPETAEQRLALRADLYELGMVLAKLNYRGIAQRALGEAREYYLKSEPNHPAIKSIDAQLKRLESSK